MGLADELTSQVKEIFRSRWTERDGTVVPEDDDIGLGNDAVKLDGVVLYADLVGSTNLVNDFPRNFAAEVYKTYLHCAAKVIRSEGGEITAYDGDRIMAVFLGDYKNTSAGRCALKINHAVLKIINPALAAQYGSDKYTVRQVVGIDSSDLYVARTGIRGANDLVWVGPSANYAAKLCELREADFNSWVTDRVYSRMHSDVKTSSGVSMWDQRKWAETGMIIYGSSWRWGGV